MADRSTGAGWSSPPSWILGAGLLAGLSFAGRPPVVLVFALAGVLAGGSSLQLTVRSSIVPKLVGSRLRSALTFNFGSYQLTAIVGPGLGGVLIATAGVPPTAG